MAYFKCPSSMALIILASLLLQATAALNRQAIRTHGFRDIVQEQRNKELVLEFYRQLFGNHNLLAIDQYVSPEYIQHDPTVVANGIDALRQTVSAAFPPGTNVTSILIERAVADGDYVWLHVMRPLTAGAHFVAIAEIYRVKDNLIAENFFTTQPLPSISANPQPMFSALATEFAPHCEFARDPSQIPASASTAFFRKPSRPHF